MGKLNSAQQKSQKEVRDSLKRAQAHQRRFSSDWDDNRDLMLGRFAKGQRNGIAEAYGMFRTLVSNILVSVPEAYFEAKQERYTQIAGLLSEAVNYDFMIGKLYDKMVKALWQTFPYGYGVVAEQMETDFDYDKKGEVMGIKKSRFFWKNIPPRDALFDPDGFDIQMDDHRFGFIAHYKTPDELRQAKKNDGKPLYFNLDEIEKLPRANEASKSPRPDSLSMVTKDTDPGPENKDFYQIKVWQVYDRVNERLCEITDAGHKLIREDDWPVPIKVQGVLQYPYQVLALDTETDGFYPPSLISQIKPQLQNLVILNDQWMSDVTTKIRKYIGLSPYVDDKKMGRLLDPKRPNSFIVTSNVDMAALQAGAQKVDSAKDIVSKVEDITPNQTTPQAIQEVRQQIQNIVGFGTMGSRTGSQPRSAKDAARLAEANQKAMQSRQTSVEAFTRKQALYHVFLLKATASTNPEIAERYVPITDKVSSLKTWLTLNPNDIPDERDLFCDVYVGTSSPRTLDTKRAQFLQEMQVLGPYLMQLGASPMPLLQRYAEVFQVRNFDQLFKNPKGKAMELLGLIAKSARSGQPIPPDTLLMAQQALIEANLSPAEQQAVIAAVTQQGQGTGRQAPPTKLGGVSQPTGGEPMEVS